MSFLTPLFLLLGLLAGPIIILYMLRLRRREVMVSSTLLWQKLLRDREANAPWQKLRRNLLLILQLIILAALVFALARPFLPTPSIISGSVVVLLDASASMLATDVEPTRFDAAKAEVAQLISDLGGDSQMTLIKVGQTPTVLAAATNDRAQLQHALDEAQPDPADAAWNAAFALATGAAQGFRDGRIVIISDGGLPDDLPPLPVESIYLPIGESGENLAITALATRETESGIQLFASVQNEGLLDRETLLSIDLDGALFDSRRLTVPAGGSVNATWDLPPGTATIRAYLGDNEGDFLPLDDVAWAVHEGGVSNRTLLVTEGNLFLEQVFTVLPGIEAFKVPPGSELLDPETFDYDLVIFDGVALPDPPPAADMLIINPQAGGEGGLFSVTGTFSNTITTRLEESPLLQFVDWSEVDVRQAQRVSAPWAQTLVAAEGGPLLEIGEQNGYRIALLTFDLRDSDLPLQIAFPILMANITGWLSPGRAFDAPTGLQPGDPVAVVPGASSTAVLVEKPDGNRWTAEVGEEDLFFTETDQPGLYTVLLRDAAADRPAGSFAVNLFSPAESAIRPVESLQIGQTQVETEDEGDVGQRELWPWLLAIAVVVLIVEWWVHHRGTRWPKLPNAATLNRFRRNNG
ncbi:MAG: BatA domain-containing protein [Ardenticatenaceae bacterium]|nr:BatA domain-containing protein [Ardenticatenaceae bacterium]MCB8948004.1 BatA domain-containing protein [Ardenticatenaceae bacterium]